MDHFLVVGHTLSSLARGKTYTVGRGEVAYCGQGSALVQCSGKLNHVPKNMLANGELVYAE